MKTTLKRFYKINIYTLSNDLCDWLLKSMLMACIASHEHNTDKFCFGVLWL